MNAEFGSEGFDVGVDGAIHGGTWIVPGLLKQLLTGKDATGLPEENREKFIFMSGEIEWLAAASDAHCSFVVA